MLEDKKKIQKLHSCTRLFFVLSTLIHFRIQKHLFAIFVFYAQAKGSTAAAFRPRRHCWLPHGALCVRIAPLYDRTHLVGHPAFAILLIAPLAAVSWTRWNWGRLSVLHVSLDCTNNDWLPERDTATRTVCIQCSSGGSESVWTSQYGVRPNRNSHLRMFICKTKLFAAAVLQLGWF